MQMPDRTLLAIEHKLISAQGILRRAALEAETLRDQGLADDLHLMLGDITMRILPSVRRGSPASSIDGSRT
jgi:hypothetical protein